MEKEETLKRFYTNVIEHRNRIIDIGYQDGKKYFKKLNFQPSIFFESNEPSEFFSIHGNTLKEKRFESISKYREYIRENKDIITFHGEIEPKYQYIHKFLYFLEYFISTITGNLFSVILKVEKKESLLQRRSFL